MGINFTKDQVYFVIHCKKLSGKQNLVVFKNYLNEQERDLINWIEKEIVNQDNLEITVLELTNYLINAQIKAKDL